MLRSLEKLRGGISITLNVSPDEITLEAIRQVADEIQAEIDKFYLPRPLFEDGGPVQIGDYVDLQCEGKRRVQVTDIRPWIVYGSSTSHQREPYKRPPEPDSQEKIHADILLPPRVYCEKYGLDTTHGQRMDTKTRHLLARQRKLDGVE